MLTDKSIDFQDTWWVGILKMYWLNNGVGLSWKDVLKKRAVLVKRHKM